MRTKQDNPRISDLGRRRYVRGTGFTLIELVLALTLLILVLTTTYRLLVNTLEAEQHLDRLTVPEKVGEGLLSLVRRDLSGTFFRNMGYRVFLVSDGGALADARDEIRFLTTVEPTPLEEEAGGVVGSTKLRTITGVGYFLRPSTAGDVDAYTLFRKESTEFDEVDPLESPGINYELYNRVKYLSIECFDGWSWFETWDSEARILAEADDALALAEEGEGIARVSNPQATPGALAAAPGVSPEGMTGSELLPPAAVPVAVRIEIGIYVVSGDRILRDTNGEPLIKSYATIIPILSAQRIPIQLDSEEYGEEALGDGEAGLDSTANPAGLLVPGAGGSGRATPGSRLGGRFRGRGGPTGSSGGGNRPPRTSRLRLGPGSAR